MAMKITLRRLEELWNAKVAQVGIACEPEAFSTRRFECSWGGSIDVRIGGGVWGGSVTVCIRPRISESLVMSSDDIEISMSSTKRNVAQMVTLIADLQRATELAAYAAQLFNCEIELEDSNV